MDVPRRILLLVGSNAQGKTSLLEAVYYLATFTSFHAQTDRQLINFLTEDQPLAVTRLVAEYQRGEKQHRLEVRLILERENGNGRLRKEILLDGVRKAANDAMGSFLAVMFLPQMMRIVEGSPEERRRYLNLALCQAFSGYAQALSEYNQALTQRNALLKQLAERGGDSSQLLYWDSLVADRGAFLIHSRIQAIDELERVAARIHLRLTQSREVLRLLYQPAYDPAPEPDGQYKLKFETKVDRKSLRLDQIRQGFAKKLEFLRSEEIARGMTTIGPHRDELRFFGDMLDLGYYGSRGQVRTALMALKLAEVEWLREKTGQWPVLLLDEILAELDAQHRLDLQDALGECEQAIITTTDLNLFRPGFVQTGTIWQVEAGRVTC